MSEKPNMTVCKNCGAQIAKNAKVCPSCGAKNKKPFYKRIWFYLLILILVIGVTGIIGKNRKEKFDWNEVELCERLPKPKSNAKPTETPGEDTELTEGMRPEFKKAMDSYEAFMNEYCDFMKKYAESDGTDPGLLADYADYMSRYADVVRDFEAWDNGELNTAETIYYADVQTRVSKRLLEAGQK